MHAFLIPVLILTAWVDLGQVAPPPAPCITVYSVPSCNFCHKLRREVSGDCDRDWRFKSRRINHPAWVADKLAKGEAFPFVVWKDASGKEVYQSGWKGKQDFLKRFNKSRGLPPPAEPAPADGVIPEPSAVAPPEPKP